MRETEGEEALVKLGLVCHSSIGGSGVIAAELGEQLAARGHQVHLFSNGAPPRARSITTHVVQSPVHELFPGGEYALALASALAGLELDLIHAHYAIPHAVSALLASQMRGAKLVVTLHGTDVLTVGRDPALRPVLRHAVARSDGLTAPTRYLCEQAERTFGRRPEHVGNFVDVERFCPPKPPRSAARPLPPTLLHHSSFRPLKRVEDVVRAFALVHRRLPEARLVLVGDGPTRPAVEELARDLPVTFTGEQHDVVPHLQRADVFLFPSELESFGLAALEALACGVPVIATRTGGLPELVEDGVNGWLHPVGDVEGMAGRALELLSDATLHARFSQGARQSAEERWRPEPKVALYETLYRRVLAKGP
jgi:N-acetyl-alpha-D-glucosaminyl L-malate synthase BshA